MKPEKLENIPRPSPQSLGWGLGTRQHKHRSQTQKKIMVSAHVDLRNSPLWKPINKLALYDKVTFNYTMLAWYPQYLIINEYQLPPTLFGGKQFPFLPLTLVGKPIKEYSTTKTILSHPHHSRDWSPWQPFFKKLLNTVQFFTPTGTVQCSFTFLPTTSWTMHGSQWWSTIYCFKSA